MSARDAALALHGLLARRFWREDGLVGPDYGVRLNYRAGRFVKSYLGALPWRDSRYYLQAQGYWILANWRLWELGREELHRSIATRCSEVVVAHQQEDGAWAYPNPAWRGRIATVEGTWASLGLIESYRRTGDRSLLDSALRWHTYLEDHIGWHRAGPGIAVNYFAGQTGSTVPNNSALVLRLLAELADATAEEELLARCDGLLGFLETAQLPTGELPYAVGGAAATAKSVHFQCHQYNAFACLDLMRYGELTGDPRAAALIASLVRFLSGAPEADGRVPYACGQRDPEVSYHAAAVAAALHEGEQRGIPGSGMAAHRVTARLLARQRPDGGFWHSRRDYGVLRDRRYYPRSLAMILHHLLALAGGERAAPAPAPVASGSR